MQSLFSRVLSARQSSLTLLFGVILLAALSTACGNKPADTANTKTPSGPAQPQTSLPMPPLAASHGNGATSERGFTLLDNRRMKLSSYLGQVVVLDFYATWCPPCREETPHLVELQRRYGAQGLQVIGLNVGGPEDREKVPGFVQEFGIQYQLGYPDPEMTQLYLTDDDRIPQAYVFDRKGRLVKRFISYDSTVPAEMEGVVQKALAAKAD
ncbi:MAG TPA: redoxin domain-containing protein [Pyrinomonadaceae bacterium]|jgi:thiol-disulfide isomerase/thioredoxin